MKATSKTIQKPVKLPTSRSRRCLPPLGNISGYSSSSRQEEKGFQHIRHRYYSPSFMSPRIHPHLNPRHPGTGHHRHHQQRTFFTRKKNDTAEKNLTAEEEKEFDDLVHIAQKRNVKITVKKGTQAGFAAGLCIMGGTVVGGPVGAVVGGVIGTGIATKISKQVVSLKQISKETPRGKRLQVYKVFSEALQEEFHDGFQENPELKLLLGGGSIIGVMRYCLDRDMIESDRLERLDGILKRFTEKSNQE